MQNSPKIVLYTNIVSPHQVPLALDIIKLIGEENFRYIVTDPLHGERTKLGWGYDIEGLNVLECHKPKHSTEIKDWLENCDLLLTGNRACGLFEKRACSPGKITCYMSERWFKPPLRMIRLLDPRYLLMAWRVVRLLRSGHIFYLPMGIHAASDIYRLCGLFSYRFVFFFNSPRIESVKSEPMSKMILSGEWSSSACYKKDGLEQMRLWGYFVKPATHGSRPHMAMCQPKRSVGSKDPLRVLWVGRMLWCKRVDTLIKAVTTLLDDEQKIYLKIVGYGAEEVRLRQLAKRWLISSESDWSSISRSGISFSAPMSIDEIRILMKSFDVYVLPSNECEGWGAVVNEALAEGMCVIATHEAGSSATLLKHGVNGLLFSAGNTSEIVHCLQVAMQYERRNAMQVRAEKMMKNEWSSSFAAAQLVSFLNENLK